MVGGVRIARDDTLNPDHVLGDEIELDSLLFRLRKVLAGRTLWDVWRRSRSVVSQIGRE